VINYWRIVVMGSDLRGGFDGGAVSRWDLTDLMGILQRARKDVV
jgi:hypothetical protein